MLAYLALLPFVFLLVRIFNLARNYNAARKLNLPMIILPVSFEDPLWLLLRPLFSWVERLPFGLGSWYLYTDMGWPMVDGDRTPSRLGENFILVAPTRNQIMITYPPAIERVYRDNKGWIIPPPHSQVFTAYGQNVSSTNGSDWQRHRKITATAFGEKSMRYVWEESIQRSAEVLNFPEDTKGTDRTIAGIRTDLELFAMHVLASVAFGQDNDLTSIPSGHRLTLMDSLAFILRHVFVSIVFSGLKAPDIFMPKILRRLKLSVSELRLYMEECVLRQMQAPQRSSKDGSPNSAKSKYSYLADSELYGNLFVFNLAGYETTASTMSFALPYLALYPEFQDWVTEEVDAHYTNKTSQTSYEETYPKLIRCLAFMYETLRLSGPAPQMIRAPVVPTELTLSSPGGGNTSITVQPDTLIAAHFYGTHLSPRWGSDVHDFNPKRFVAVSPTGEETIASPPEGAMFMAWVFGNRVCPGKKFSQVEFVAVIAHVISQYRIELLKESEAESEEAARRRVMSVMDEKFFNVSTHLRRPGDAGVRFVGRR
ncbi:putative cytochrome P450 [Rhizodiscina lignyota]|uniref:Cytochrome P450 n=1 Tax=Rhizodiscina lignyota TaxID=1504668 RepID=A0A9P4M357_9PEZI|nr:putative cytochrome P450 [Rhizodiscina lignyota]